MERYLIVNADDFFLTDGVSRGILKAHDRGIVTSTSCLTNLPIERKWIRELKARGSLGVGLHLNVTLGKPLASPRSVSTLCNALGQFYRYSMSRLRKGDRLELQPVPFSTAAGACPPAGRRGLRWGGFLLKAGRNENVDPAHLLKEWSLQIEKFFDLLGRRPTHLDTHHHLHAKAPYFDVLIQLAARYRLPFRYVPKAKPFLRKRFAKQGIRLPHRLWGSLAPRAYWTRGRIRESISRLPSGVTEWMCHPGICDERLQHVSSFCEGREAELRSLSSPRLKRTLLQHRILLTNYSRLKVSTESPQKRREKQI